MNYKNAADGFAPIANKIGAFLAHPLVRKAVCEPETPLRFRQIMDTGQSLIINLAKGRLGTDVSNVLGGLIISSIANAAYTRQNLAQTNRRPFFLYIDEFHAFTTATIADMLSELRKYGLGISLKVVRAWVSAVIWSSFFCAAGSPPSARTERASFLF